MESLSSLQNEINLLYEHMKGDQICSNFKNGHTGSVIYFCTHEECELRHSCSECLIENPSHFALHVKNLLPVDDKNKFYKCLNFSPDLISGKLKTEEEGNANSKSSPENELSQFYLDLKYKINSLIDIHMKNNYDNFVEQIRQVKESSKKNEEQKDCYVNNIYVSMSQLIQDFIQNKNKSKIHLLIKDLNDTISGIKSTPQDIIPKRDFDPELEKNLNNLINSTIVSYFDIPQVIKPDDMKEIRQRGSLNILETRTNIDNLREDIIGQLSSTPTSKENIKHRLESLKEKLTKINK